MINKLKEVIKLTIVSTMLLLPAAAIMPAHVGAQVDCSGIAGCLDQGAVETDPEGASEDPSTEVNEMITLVINIFSVVVGVVAVIMIIIGGFKYITSAGDAGNVTGAKNTIMYAIIGLVIVALAQIIVRFVLQKTTGE